MGSRRVSRTRSLSSYLNSVDQLSRSTSYRVNARNTIATNSIGESAIAEELELFDKTIQSGNFVPGYSGWQISGNGNAEFGNVVVRGDINASSGTIGYWNISNPTVSRVIGTTTLLGTFIESTVAGNNDEDLTSGTYVGLFKSLDPDDLDVTYKERVSNVATLTVESHDFAVGDLVLVALEDDTSFNNSNGSVTVTETTLNTFSYANPGTDVSYSEALGYAQLYVEDVAGLYLRDYGKVDFDYGYFSNKGIKYVAADKINILMNPSFEYEKSSSKTIIAESVIVTGIPADGRLTLYSPGHGLENGAAIEITDTTILVDGISIAATYNVQYATADTFQIDSVEVFTTNAAVIQKFYIQVLAQSIWSLSGWELLRDLGSIVSTVSKAITTNEAIIATTSPHQFSVGDYVRVAVDGYSPVAISSVSATASVVTITTSSAHGIVAGERVTVSGISLPGFNGTEMYVLSAPTTTTFTYYRQIPYLSDVPATAVSSATAKRVVFDGVHEITAIPSTSLFKYSLTHADIASASYSGTAYIEHSWDPSRDSSIVELSEYEARSAYGYVPITRSRTTSDYISATVDYLAASQYKIIEDNRQLYLGFDMFYSMSPVPAGDSITTAKVGGESVTRVITTRALTTNVATITTSTAHGYLVGNQVIISGVGAPFDGTYPIKAVPTTTTFTYDKVSTNVTSGAALAGSTALSATMWLDKTSTVTARSLTSNVATITTGTTVPHDLQVGSYVTVSGVDSVITVTTKARTVGTPGVCTLGFASNTTHQITVGNVIVVSINDPEYDGTHTVTSASATAITYSKNNATAQASTATSGTISLATPIYNGTFVVTSVPTAYSFTYSVTNPNLASVARGGTAVSSNRIALTSYSISSQVVTINTAYSHGFVSGDQVTLNSFISDPYLLSAFGNITYFISSVPSNTSFTFALPGASDIASTNFDVSKRPYAFTTYVEITTFTAHGLVPGDYVFLDVVAKNDSGLLTYSQSGASANNPNLYAERSFQPPSELSDPPNIFRVLSTRSTTSYKIINSTNQYHNNTWSPDLILTPKSSEFLRSEHTTYRIELASYDLNDIALNFGTGTDVGLSEFVSDSYLTNWSTNRYVKQANYSDWIESVLSAVDTFGYSYMSIVGGVVPIDISKITAKFSELNPTGYSENNNFQIKFPLWMRKINLSGSVGSTKARMSLGGSIGFALDSVYLSTSTEYFFGDLADSTSWYDSGNGNSIPMQSSVAESKTWIDIDLASQTGVLDYLDYVGFKPSETNRYFMTSPSINSQPVIAWDTSSIARSYSTTDSGLWNYPSGVTEKSALTLTSGMYQDYDANNFDGGYYLYEGAVRAYSSIDFSGVEVSAHRLASDISGTVSPTNSSRSTLSLTASNRDFDGRAILTTDVFTVAPHRAYDSFNDQYSPTYVVFDDATLKFTSSSDYGLGLVDGDPGDASLTSTDHALQIGEDAETNMIFNPQEIQVRNNGVAGTLWLNASGGQVRVASTLVVSGLIDNNAAYSTANDWLAQGLSRKAVWVNSSGQYGNAASSSRKIKRDFSPLGYDYNSMISIEPMKFRYIPAFESLGESAPVEIGMIAEDLHDAGLTELVYYDDQGEVEGINYTSYVVALQSIVRSQHDMLISLSARLDALEDK